MAEFKIDRSGDLRSGYFYRLDVNFSKDQSEGQDSSWIVSGSPHEETFARYACGIYYRSRKRYECQFNADHHTTSLFTYVEIDVHGDNFGPFVPTGPPNEIVNGDLSDRLKTSTLKGLEVADGIGANKWDDPDDRKLYVLQFLGRPCRRPASIFPATENKCPACGAGPVICPECGDCGPRCRRCFAECFVQPNEIAAASDPRIRVVEWRFLSEIIDPNRWDGGDFCDDREGGVMTRRALDFFLKQHAAPFKAEPLLVDMEGITDEQRDRLELAKKPVD